jgi:methionyl-tRNA formyltransferase
MDERPMRLILMGTGPFAVPSFEALRVAGYDIALVVTRPQPPVKSRKGPPPSPVRQWANQHSLTIYDPATTNDAEAIDELREIGADLLVVCDYGQILKPAALGSARLGGINLHGSLLPKYRGAAPVQWALLSGDTTTGVSVIHMTPRLDGGPVLTTCETPIRNGETAGELEERLSKIGVDATLEAITILSSWDGHSTIGEIQNPDQATKAPRLKKSDGQTDWSRTAEQIDCHVRGMQPWPVAFTHLEIAEGKPPLRISVKQISITENSSGQSVAGEILASDEFLVATADRAIRIDRLQPAGKKEMTGVEFLRGYQPTEGAKLS